MTNLVHMLNEVSSRMQELDFRKKMKCQNTTVRCDVLKSLNKYIQHGIFNLVYRLVGNTI